jgi:hypothetical protein
MLHSFFSKGKGNFENKRKTVKIEVEPALQAKEKALEKRSRWKWKHRIQSLITVVYRRGS